MQPSEIYVNIATPELTGVPEAETELSIQTFGDPRRKVQGCGEGGSGFRD